ncbi:hypothetical protein H310_13758 [Aphanomyces invadans]|uniref:BED-type domain-containing protein n=1 Tax=Aphanomyces invadans TaxID=157072 RepID=A0A024TE97_9STRA|nr:hypothetical protein H310_13758 [Aphanomyces invadans]ETV91682.1 hypothetical protein H310_13758 [Aphanomyces invadans]|eukprot:XP_008879608.1 hypothetical protein H310_13758 [Aphanomyces invadans]
MGRAELPIWQEFTEKYRAPHRRTPLVRCKTCDDEICASTTSLYQHKNNVCGKKPPRSSSLASNLNVSPSTADTVATAATTPLEVDDGELAHVALPQAEGDMQLPRVATDATPVVRKRKEIWEDFGEKYKVEGRKTLVVNCKMCGKDVAAATTSLYQHQAICANIDVPKQQKRPKSATDAAKPTQLAIAFLPVEELTKKFLSIQDTIQQLRAQLDTAHADDAPALQSALDLYQSMRASVFEKLNAAAQRQFIV